VATDYGFIGVGRMGNPMARRLLAAGFTLTVFDTSRKAIDELVAAGAKPAGSVPEACSATETVFLSLPTPDIVKATCLDAGGVTEGSTVKHVFDCSTTGPQVARLCAAGLAKKNIDYLDSPISGGIKGARDGTLAVMVSGKKGVYERVQKALACFGKVFYVGADAGQGQVMKLANNLLSASAIVLSSEAIAMGVKAGLDPAQMCDIINAGSGRNSATQDKFPRSVLTRTFDFGFATGLLYKDVRLCVQEAQSLGVPMVAGAAVLEMLGITKARFGADSDFTEIARVVEEWAGVEIKPKARA
jgi:3-hydroxyisobutyrate dehydrogenase-like beta-hydroxyacid dehydrogenase